MQPTLRYASRGPAVELVQNALNLWKQDLEPLKVDGIYGTKTTARVQAFQSSRKIASDGVVGGNTWAELQPWIEAFEKGLVVLVPPPAKEEEARERIVQWAYFELLNFGWNPGIDTPGPLNQHIRSSICADPANPFRPRQGGLHLAQIFSSAGHFKAPACPWISVEAENVYKGADNVAKQNQIDLPNWCGIFALHVYKMAGLQMPPWPIRNTTTGGNDAEMQSYVPPLTGFTKAIRKGDIGVLDGYRSNGRNHHFIVVDVTDTAVKSVDGNAQYSPGAGNSPYIKGIIREVTRASFDAKTDYFLRPRWSKVLPP
ncbi:MAG: peptidoglycan-binding protein [Deltaproteobacteria bacterium]|nr:peptidoglycan-binding protein [Deltaproteobacteria bacterium]